MTCAYCEHPLECEACRAAYLPPSGEDYEALSRPEVPLACSACGEPLVCRWCRTPYDGRSSEEASPD